MTGFILAFLAVLLAGLGARDQIVLAGVAQRQGSRPGLLLTAITLSMGTAAFAAWAAMTIIPLLGGDARLFLAALALGFAGGESLLLAPGRGAQEPTHSLIALAVVLAAHQLTDAARFLVFGIGLAAAAPLSAGLGGAAGGAVLLGLAWSAPEYFTWQRLRLVRRTIGILLLVLALYTGLHALGRIRLLSLSKAGEG